MDEDNREKNLGSNQERVSGDLGGETFNFYFHIFRWPLLFVLIGEIILIILRQKAVYLWFINLLFFAVLTLWLYYTYRVRMIHVIILGSLAGFILGFLIALFKLIFERKLYLFFNLISESVITLLFGFLISAATYLLISKESRKNNILSIKKEKKGGELNGRGTNDESNSGR